MIIHSFSQSHGLQPWRSAPFVPRRAPLLVFACCLFFAAAIEIHAAPEEAAIVEVRAVRPTILPAPTAGRSTLSAEEIAASGADSLAKALEILPGVTASGAGSSGAKTTISLRGSTANQVLVLVDGVPASDPSTGLVDFSELGLAVEDVESVEVVRGGASAQFGADAVGGVILITTKRSSGRPGQDPAPFSIAIKAANVSRAPFAWTSGYGAAAFTEPADPASLVDSQELSVRAAFPGGLSISAGGERAANEYYYRDANEEVRRRENADLLGGKASLGWSGHGLGGQLGVAVQASAREVGVPGTSSSPTPAAREADRNARASVEYETDSFFSDMLGFKSNLHGSLAETKYRESPAASEDRNLASRSGIDARWSLLAGESGFVSFGLSGRYERLDSDKVLTSAGETPERFTGGAYIEPSIALASWTIAPAARFDWTSDFPAGPSFSLGLARKLPSGLVASLNASSSYRAPSFSDLYWPEAGGAAGNPSLNPESSIGGDAGLSYERVDEAFSATLYARYARDVILWQPDAGGIWRPSNWGEAFYPGLELEARRSKGPYSARLSYTYLRSYVLSGGLKLSDDKRLPMTPEHSFDAVLGYESETFSVSLSLSYTGLRYEKIDNRAYLPSHLVVGARLEIPVGSGSSLSFDAENLLNERYESVQGYPVPGFSLKTAIAIELGGTNPSH